MITKGIIEEILSPYSARVRLPIFDSIKDAQNSVSTGNLRVASICSLPNCTNLLGIGDIVFVGFEDDDLGKPVILGNLVKEQPSTANPSINSYALNIDNSVNLPGTVSINNTDNIDLTQLIGLKCNVQAALNQITANISDMPTVPSALSWQTPISVSEIVNAIMWKVDGQILDIHQIWGIGSGTCGTVAVEEQQQNEQGAAYIYISESTNKISVKGALYTDDTTSKLVWIDETNISVTLSDWKVLK